MNCPLCQEKNQIEIAVQVIDRARSRCPICGVEIINHAVDSSAIKITEARLHNYSENRIKLEMLPPNVSRDIMLKTGTESGPSTSMQEVWVSKHEREMREVATIDRVMELLAPEEQELIRQAYFYSRNWDDVIQELHLTKSTFYRQKDRLVRRFARAFGLL